MSYEKGRPDRRLGANPDLLNAASRHAYRIPAARLPRVTFNGLRLVRWVVVVAVVLVALKFALPWIRSFGWL